MSKGAGTITELARAVEILKTRDRNRARDMKAIRAELVSIRDSLGPARGVTVGPQRFERGEIVFIDRTLLRPAECQACGGTGGPTRNCAGCGGAGVWTPKPERSWLTRILDRWVKR